MPESMRSIILRTDRPRLAGALVYSRITGRPAVYAQAPVTMATVPEPPLPTGAWVRVRSTLAGICGSDLKTLRLAISTRAANQAHRRAGTGPIFLGHETVGVITEASTGCAWARTGQRIAMIPHTPCAARSLSPCAACRDGLTLLCDHRDDPAPPELAGAGGGWSDRFLRHESQVFAMPDAIPDAVGVLFDPIACAAHCVLRKPPAAGDTVLVIGAGTIGLACIAILRLVEPSARIIALVRHPFQADAATRAGAHDVIRAPVSEAYDPLARAIGSTAAGHRPSNRVIVSGFHAVYDTVGSADTLHHALRWTRPRGAVIVEGVNLFPGILDRTPLWHREITVLGALGHGAEQWNGKSLHTFDLVAGWITDGRLDLGWLLTHRFAFENFRAAITSAADKPASASIKVALEFSTP